MELGILLRSFEHNQSLLEFQSNRNTHVQVGIRIASISRGKRKRDGNQMDLWHLDSKIYSWMVELSKGKVDYNKEIIYSSAS